MRGGDWFLDIFTAEAEKLLEQLREEQPPPPPPREWWVGGLPDPAPDAEPLAAAVDGGGALEPLRYGGALYLARAYGYMGQHDSVRELELRLLPVRDLHVLDALRTWVEARAAARVAARLPPGSLLLLDGSGRATLGAALTAVAKAACGAAASLSLAYTAYYSMFAIISLAEALRLAMERGVTVVFVSKDHSYRVLKELVLLEYAAKLEPKLRHSVAKALQWYPLVAREELAKLRREVSAEARRLLDAALDPSYRDAAFIRDAVGEEPGYTLPVAVPPSRRLYNVMVGRGPGWAAERLCSYLEDVLGSSAREVQECLEARRRFAVAVDSLPKLDMVYLRIVPGDSPLLLELVDWSSRFLSPGRSYAIEAQKLLTMVISTMVRDYYNSEYYNMPLIAAHMSATVDSATAARYRRILEMLAATRGLKLEFARRSRIASALRGGRRLRRA